MSETRGEVVQNISGTKGLVGRKVGVILDGPNANVECLYGVLPSVPLP